MDYFAMAKEYRETAEKLNSVYYKYLELAKTESKINREHYNSVAYIYRNLYYDVLNTAKLLEEKGKKYELLNKN